jgi:cyclic beta-1,2-glucan synthetase
VPDRARTAFVDPPVANASEAIVPDDRLAGPIRGELLGVDQLAERARNVARNERIREGRRGFWRPAPLLERLMETHEILERCHKRLTDASERTEVGPAGDWFLDNYHVVQEHIREVRASLPGSYYRELPELTEGPLTGYPRAYEIAITIISHTEGRVDLDNTRSRKSPRSGLVSCGQFRRCCGWR